MVTSIDVARYAGVSQATVSRALRQDPRVSEKTRLHVEEVAKKLGYVPNAAGRALASGKTDRVGLLVTDLSNEFYHRIISPVAERVQQLGKELVLLLDSPDEKSIPHRVQALGLEGVILGTTTTDSFVPYYLREQNVPFVYFTRTAPAIPSDSAVVDVSEGFFAMLDCVLQYGHRKVALINGPENSTTGRGRAEALQGYLAGRGISIPAEYSIMGDFRIETGVEGFQKLWALDERPTVILCGNDAIAMGVINQAYRQQVSIPSEVSVVGFDDIPEAKLPVYDLTTVGYDLQKLAFDAVDLLIERVEQPSKDFEERTVKSYFISRKSLGPCPNQYESKNSNSHGSG